MVVDSSVFVDILRDYQPAKEISKNLLAQQSASIITEFELIAGTHTKAQMNMVLKLLKTMEIKIIPINEDISEIANKLFKNYYHSHKIDVEDAFVAATAIVHNGELATRNKKHFSFIPNLKLITPY